MNKILKISLIVIYFLFIGISLIFHFESGEAIGNNFFSFAFSMLKIVPVAFVLIGLFEVWIRKETIEKHLGEDSSWIGFFWAIVLSSTTAGGLYVAFPIAAVLYKKGAKLSIIFTYLGAVSVCRIPMTIFEASFLGIKFTLVRLLISLPLIIISSIIMGRFLTNTRFEISGN